MKAKLTLLTIFIIIFNGFAQHERNNFIERSSITLQKTKERIIVDGNLNEQTWTKLPSESPFYNQWPLATGSAKIKTEIKVTYNDEFLYFAITTYQNKEDITLLSLKRDNSQGNWLSDAVMVLLDPINKKTNGFLFGVNSAAAQFEGLLSAQGGHTNTDVNWDNKWYASTKVHENFWIAEIAIPFKSLRFDKESKTWGLNFIRADMENNHYSTWSKVPVNFDAQSIGYFGALNFEELPNAKTSNISLIPYVAGSYIHNREYEPHDDSNFDIGGDAKIAVTSSLNLDLTINPDFSNVDVDEQVINLSRFNIFFPEKRNFFLENSDLFTSFGTGSIAPFFSRRIGLDDYGNPITILGGARLTGNLTESLRVGVLDVQTKGETEFLPNNYFVGSFQKTILGRSTISGLFTNRVSTSNDEATYNRTAGIEAQYVSDDGLFSTRGLFHKSFTSNSAENDDVFYGSDITYNKGNFSTNASFYRVGKGYQSDLGFVPRLYHYNADTYETEKIGFWQFSSSMSYLFRPKEKSWYNQQGIQISSFISNGLDKGKMDREFTLEYSAYLANTGSFLLGVNHIDRHLFVPTKLIDTEVSLPIGDYKFYDGYAYYQSDVRKNFTYSTYLSYGAFYTGTKLSLTQTANFRVGPWINLGVNYYYNDVNLKSNYGEQKIHLIAPKLEVNFTNNLFWTTFSQYNSQSETININSRLQWRYNSMCDLFVVYSDNYDESFSKNKNRGVVLKLTYWLTM